MGPDAEGQAVPAPSNGNEEVSLENYFVEVGMRLKFKWTTEMTYRCPPFLPIPSCHLFKP